MLQLFKVFRACLPIFAQNFRIIMIARLLKSFTVVAFSLFLLLFSVPSFAKDGENEKKQSFNAQKVIFGHILDGHEFHFLDIFVNDSTTKPIGIPLPIIIYSPQTPRRIRGENPTSVPLRPPFRGFRNLRSSQ